MSALIWHGLCYIYYLIISNLLVGTGTVTKIELVLCVSDPGGSGFKLPGWIRIRIQNPDPESEIELFPQIFNDFHLFLKMIGTNKSSLFNKIPT